MNSDSDGLPSRAARLAGSAVAAAGRLGGGSLSEIWRIRLADGREIVAKNGPAPRVEAAMLRAIRASGAPAPNVLAVDDDVLVIEALAAGEGPAGAWSSLGEALGTLHAATGERFGWDASYAFGPVAIVNDRQDDWPAFWGRQRLVEPARGLVPELARRIDALAGRLPDLLPAAPRPALLHGDLWGGNVLAAGGRVTGLVDPACYYGHGEVDLAMLGLFDAPTPAFFSAYGALEPGHEARRAIYQLWPAIVHARLFGSGYRPLVERLLGAVGA